jgi:hypothetical protein
MGPAWLGWLACVSVLLWAHRQPRAPLAHALLLGALLVPFGFAESSGFRFDEWVLWPPIALPNGFLLLASIAKLIVFVPPRAATWPRVAGVSAAALLSSVQLGLVPSGAQLAGGLATCVLALWLWRRHPDSGFAQPAAVTALLLLHHYAVRVPTSAYYWQDCLLAALVLSARLVRNLSQPSRTSGQALLLLFAFFASGWINFAWTLHRLEWGFLYDFWGAAFIESHVAAFLPLLVGRFALTLIAARILLRRELPATHATEPNEALGLAWLLSGSKVASLMFWSYGIAFVNVASDVYLEAVQETSLACVLLLGLL